MKIGVVIATYNGIRFIKEQLDSIIIQTVKVDEIIISDDGSTDGTVEFISDYIKLHKEYNIKLVENTGIHGSCKNFENACKYTNADLVFFCDQDDVWKSDKIEIFLEAANSYPECGLFFSDAEVTNSKLEPIGKKVWDEYFVDGQFFPTTITKIERDYMVERIKWSNCITGMNMAVRRDLLLRIMPFDPVVFHDDLISIFCSVNSYICSINKVTAYYRQHEDNVVGCGGSFNSQLSRRNSFRGLIKYSSVNLISLLYDYRRSLFFQSLNENDKYKSITKIYNVMKFRYDSSLKNSFYAFFLFAFLGIRGGYISFGGAKYFILDEAMILFVPRKKRKEYLLK